jgi:hypothetical protein
MFSSLQNSFNSSKDKISASLEKMPKTKVLKKTEKPKPKYLELTWRFFRNASYVIVFLSFGILKYVYDIFVKRGADEYVLKLYRILSFFIIINLVTYCFLYSYHQYRTNIKGGRGPPGIRGKRGVQGESSSCNICEKKVGTFRRNRRVKDKKEYIKEIPTINFESEAQRGWNTLENSYTYDCNTSSKVKGGTSADDSAEDTNKTFNIINRTTVGPNCPVGITPHQNIPAPSNNDSKPIVGVAANFDKHDGTLYTLQYMYDRNKEHDPHNHKIGMFGGVKNGKFGINEDKGEKNNFVCPPNSAIYRVDSVSDPSGIKGLKFYCQDITTGKQVKALDNNNKEVSGVVFGIEPRPDTKTLNYQTTQCNSTKIKIYDTIKKNGQPKNVTYRKIVPSFFSNVGGCSDDKNIKNLKFNKCSYYRDWELSPNNENLSCDT